MISHRASLTFIDWATACFALQPTDRVANHAPLHFDLSIFDLFATIKSGGTVILVPPLIALFPRQLAQFIVEQHITVWYSAPSALIQLALHGELSRFAYKALRLVLFAGEVFPIKHLRTLMTLLPHPAYYNLYGPTETNVCTWYRAPQLTAERVEPLSIGQACANSEIILLNEKQERVAPGEVGELCVRGPGLMKGYWGLPEKTAAVLHPYPVHPALGAQLIYHTGDLVREDDDGNLLYLGRRDNQIKSRGYRIELGEIEATLYSHPAVIEATVLAIPDETIGHRLAALVVPQPAVTITPGALEAFCAERLPKYMIPSPIEFRPTLPKTSTGKVDNVRLRQEMMERQEDRETR
jgi:acyl-CoA synthetase (AMP-forming)/AMP-acid ligase II